MLIARATVVQLYSYFPTGFLLIAYQKSYIGLPSSISFYHRSDYAPPLGVLKIYEGLS
ncbi:unnamed protein product, partial [Rotaria magnacalcarata]